MRRTHGAAIGAREVGWRVVTMCFARRLRLMSEPPLRTGAGPRAQEAYATLLYGADDAFFLGARVLGRSIRRSGSTRPMVMLATEDVTAVRGGLGWLGVG